MHAKVECSIHSRRYGYPHVASIPLSQKMHELHLNSHPSSHNHLPNFIVIAKKTEEFCLASNSFCSGHLEDLLWQPF